MRCSANTNDAPSARSTLPVTLSSLQAPEKIVKLDPPMSNWFSSVPHAMDTLSYSVKAGISTTFRYSLTENFQFQQDMLTSLIRFLRGKIVQQRDALLRSKQEREELKNLRKCARHVHLLNSSLTCEKGRRRTPRGERATTLICWSRWQRV